MAKKIIKARLKQRTDTQANWAANNPVLLEGELGLVTDDKNLYKVGDGVTAWNDLPFRGFDGTLVHETGDSDNAAMSQRGVTQALAALKESMVKKVPGKGLSTEDYTTEEKKKLAGLQNFNDAEIKDKLAELSGEVANIGKTKIVPTIENGKYIVATGYVGATSDSCVTDYVPVGNTTEAFIYGAYLTDSRCIVGFNEKKEVVTAWETHTNDTPLIIPEDVEYIRITGRTGVAPYVVITDASITNKIINGVKEVVVAESPSINKEEFSSGYLASDGKTIYSSSSYRTSHYIPVVGGANLVAEYITLTSQGAIWWYDERENLLSVEPGSDVATKLKLTFNVPISARYCRYVVETGFLDRSKLSYAENTFKYNAEIDKVNAIMSKSYDAPLNLFSAATSRPIITIIDDDTIIADYVTRFYNALSAVGVTGSYAVLTNQIEPHPELAELLLSYDRKGFNACLHSYTQHVAFETATRDLSVAREDLVRGIQEMQKMGFTDFRHWVTPYGVNDAEMQDLAIKVGLDCLVSIGQSKVVGTAPTDSRYNIPRYSWNAAGEITAIKSLIDQCSANNGWLLLGTHVYNWAEGAFESAIAEVVAYAKSKGCVFMTLGEALRHRMPIYNFYETM